MKKKKVVKGLSNGAKLTKGGKKKVGYKKLRIEYSVPKEQTAVFANGFVVQHHEAEFYLLFFQTNPPILIKEAEDFQQKVGDLTSVESQCVAKLVVSASRIPQILQALATNFANFQAEVSGNIEEYDVDLSEGKGGGKNG